MNLKTALPPLVLLLGACARTPEPKPIPAVAELRQCPSYPLPPKTLLKTPSKTDFLKATD